MFVFLNFNIRRTDESESQKEFAEDTFFDVLTVMCQRQPEIVLFFFSSHKAHEMTNATIITFCINISAAIKV